MTGCRDVAAPCRTGLVRTRPDCEGMVRESAFRRIFARFNASRQAASRTRVERAWRGGPDGVRDSSGHRHDGECRDVPVDARPELALHSPGRSSTAVVPSGTVTSTSSRSASIRQEMPARPYGVSCSALAQASPPPGRGLPDSATSSASRSPCGLSQRFGQEVERQRERVRRLGIARHDAVVADVGRDERRANPVGQTGVRGRVAGVAEDLRHPGDEPSRRREVRRGHEMAVGIAVGRVLRRSVGVEPVAELEAVVPQSVRTRQSRLQVDPSSCAVELSAKDAHIAEPTSLRAAGGCRARRAGAPPRCGSSRDRRPRRRRGCALGPRGSGRCR